MTDCVIPSEARDRGFPDREVRFRVPGRARSAPPIPDRTMHHPLFLPFALLAASAVACTTQSQPRSANLAGDWDAYLASGATTRPGFEGWRRMGFAHFAIGRSGLVGSIRRRTGEPILEVTQVSTRGDSITLG